MSLYSPPIVSRVSRTRCLRQSGQIGNRSRSRISRLGAVWAIFRQAYNNIPPITRRIAPRINAAPPCIRNPSPKNADTAPEPKMTLRTPIPLRVYNSAPHDVQVVEFALTTFLHSPQIGSSFAFRPAIAFFELICFVYTS